ncbi:transposase [Streptomyces sp. TG1A-60]|uniref:IS701 family transposase n=1 Tax=Streptomyces sp. TG1A-60 TaxID=3129111 RepID=UPI0030D18625
MARGILMELEDVNCWSLAEAIGERGPHRMHHLLSRAVWDEQQALERTAGWAVNLLDDGDGILIADETGDAKSSTDAVAAARQYSGSVGGVDLCQVAVPPAFATVAGHCLIDRRLYFTKDWAGDEERRELTGVPDELCFASKPQLAAHVLHAARQRGMSASFLRGDEVYGGRERISPPRRWRTRQAAAAGGASGPVGPPDERQSQEHGARGERHGDGQQQLAGQRPDSLGMSWRRAAGGVSLRPSSPRSPKPWTGR